jgi:hypothetical protein
VPSNALAIALATELSTAPGWVVMAAALALAAGLSAAFAYRSRVEAWLFHLAHDGRRAPVQAIR